MCDDGSGVRRVAGLHPAQKSQERRGVLWHAVVRPRCELELTNLPLLTGSVLEEKCSCYDGFTEDNMLLLLYCNLSVDWT